MTPAELAAVVEAHGKWRRGEPGGIRADLADADLADADLAGADLAGANLARAYLAGAKGIAYDKLREQLGIEYDPELPRKIVAQIEAHPETWDQGSWHSPCGTKHCIAGWAVQLTPQGRYIEKQFGTANAATLLLWRDGAEMPSFESHATTAETLDRLKAFPAADVTP